MDSKERAVAAVLKLAELRSELGNIAAPTGLRSNLTSAWERLKRWKSRVVEYLRENVSDQEAKRLSAKQLRSFSMIDPSQNFIDEARLYDGYLEALIEELNAHPESVLDAIHVRVVPRAGRAAPEPIPATASVPGPIRVASGPHKVFLVHGHDEINLLRLEKLLRDKYHLVPVILRFVAGQGRTLIEKFEQEADGCSFAFVLLTPDDFVHDGSAGYAQARPNVVFELGWFCGRLGRDKVTMMLRHGTQVHSDLDGISRVEFRDSVEEKVLDIERELDAAGLRKSH